MLTYDDTQPITIVVGDLVFVLNGFKPFWMLMHSERQCKEYPTCRAKVAEISVPVEKISNLQKETVLISINGKV